MSEQLADEDSEDLVDGVADLGDGEDTALIGEEFSFLDIWSHSEKAWFLALVTPVNGGEYLKAEFYVPDVGDCRKLLHRSSINLRPARDPREVACSRDRPSSGCPRGQEPASLGDWEEIEEQDPKFLKRKGSRIPSLEKKSGAYRLTDSMWPIIPCLPVYVNIYDLCPCNSVLAPKWSPLKFGGAFHAGVEVSTDEYSFQGSQLAQYRGLPGVWRCDPRNAPEAMEHGKFRQAVLLGNTTLSASQIALVIEDMKVEYTIETYDLLARNCVHFCNDFCARLGVGRLPQWLSRVAQLADHIAGPLGYGLQKRQAMALEMENIEAEAAKRC